MKNLIIFLSLVCFCGCAAGNSYQARAAKIERESQPVATRDDVRFMRAIWDRR